MRKTISLVMATYNGARFIKEQLDSIYNQTLLPDEVIVCDDCSTDSTVEILKQYSKSKGLHYYVNERSLGVNDNFYKAMSLATCDYIAISDQDDIWLPNKIEITYNKLCEIDDGSPCVVSSLCNNIDADGNLLSELQDRNDSDGYSSSFICYDSSQGCSLMMNRNLLKIILKYKQEANERGIIYDGFISCTAAALGHKYNLGKRLMLYRHHENNVIAKLEQQKESLKKRIARKDSLGSLFPNRRLNVFSLIYVLFHDEIKDEKILRFLNKANNLFMKDSYCGELLFVSTLREISLYNKIKTIINISYIHFLKLFVDEKNN